MQNPLLKEVLARLKDTAGESYTSLSVPGHPEAEIAEHERKIGAELPADLRALGICICWTRVFRLWLPWLVSFAGSVGAMWS